jgi:hypothetical protein
MSAGYILTALLVLFVVGGVLFAVWKGGRAERMAAAVVVANLFLGLTAQTLLPQYDDLLRFANDGLAAVVLLIITLRYGAPWMGGVMFFYAAQFSLHSVYMVAKLEAGYVHAVLNNINFTGVTWCLIIGTAVAWRGRVKAARAAAAA